MIFVSLNHLRVVPLCSLREQLRVINIWRRRPILTVRQLLRDYINQVVGNFPLVAQSKTNFSLYFGVDSLVQAYYYVATRLPFETSLPGDDVIRVHFLPPEYFDSACGYGYPNLRPAESLVFWVEEACILEA